MSDGTTAPKLVNMYGCTPCPQCGDTHRAYYHRSGMVECDECGYRELALPPFGDDIEDPDGDD